MRVSNQRKNRREKSSFCEFCALLSSYFLNADRYGTTCLKRDRESFFFV